jgi:DNA modification methylase
VVNLGKGNMTGEQMGRQILIGDVVEQLKVLPDRSVATVITSPPYWGLRDYGTATWEGGDEFCDHSQFLGGNGEKSSKQITSNGTQKYQYKDICKKCGAKRKDNQIGLESTPKEYVMALQKVFSEIHRVLKDEGTLWLNLGDCYVGGKGKSGQGSPESQQKRADAGESLNKHYQQMGGKNLTRAVDNMKIMRENGLKPKDLVGIPWRVAFALQDDGWFLRQDIIWAKPNPMPESVRDRCTKSHEYLFMLTKSARYYYNHEAIREKAVTGKWKKMPAIGGLKHQENGNHTYSGNQPPNDGKRNRRSVWNISTQSFKGAHFAVMPEKLVEPCVLAGSREGDTVLDPFMGSGTVGVVAERYNRQFIGIELNPAYVDIAIARLDAARMQAKNDK